MAQIKVFSYIPNAQYQPSGVYKTEGMDIINQTIEVKQPSDSSGSSFKAMFPDVFDKNMRPYVERDAIVRAWNYTQMRSWQKQLNFAVWCATTGYGVSYQDHLSGIPEFANSMFIFHVYYQIRRILFELKAPLPMAQSWNAFDNAFYAKSYEQICAEFNVDKNTDGRQKLDANSGLGVIFNYISGTRYLPLKGF